MVHYYNKESKSDDTLTYSYKSYHRFRINQIWHKHLIDIVDYK